MRLRIMFRTKNKMKVSHFEEKRWKTVGCSKMINSSSKRKKLRSAKKRVLRLSLVLALLRVSHSGSVQ